MQRSHSLFPPPRCIFPRRVYGEWVERGQHKPTGDGVSREPGKGDRARGGVQHRGKVFAGTPDLFWQRERSGILQPCEPRAAPIPWCEEQAEPSAAGQCASTGGQRKRAVTADASEGWCGSAGFVPDDAAILWEQRPGPSKFQRGKNRRHAGGEPKCELLPQGTRAAVLQGGDLWREEECVLDFDEGSVEEGELVDDREEEDWWAQGGAGTLMLCLSRYRGPGRFNQLLRRLSMEPTLVDGRHRSGHRR
ncbi:hypothetical protein NDU88_004642 [Pleurodeles waltl]|uniref:Uncharacterized protein n=1 Tax=Pleurodeles waltl TaxID=8319 RepID=A0AAV7T9D3_PLEWA|nr:hypothetical protein NDU88_004642 [Pleurodeles waltl]